MDFKEIKNPRYGDENQDTILVDVLMPPHGFVPFSASPSSPQGYNRDIYERALAGEFGEIADYIEPEPIALESIDARQIRLGLLDLGIEDQNVIDAINGIEDQSLKDEALIEWRHSEVFPRQNPTVVMLASALGLSDEQIDELWIAAASK